MRRPGFGILVIVAVCVLGLSDTAYPCAAVRAGARLDTFTCPCPDGTGGTLENPIHVVTGTVVITSGRAAPTLGSLVVEIQSRAGTRFVPVAHQVINRFGSDFPPPRSVDTCLGAFAAGPVAGRIVFVDADGNELTFDQIKHLQEGSTTLNFIATFAGAIPELDPGERARVKVYTTASGVDATRTCTADADGDGADDFDVKTLVFQKTVRVPTTALLIAP